MRFASPAYLLLLLPIAVLVWLELRKRNGAVRFSDVSFLRAHQGMKRYIRPLLLALNTLALVLMVIALARPQQGRIIEDIESNGIDIMMCLDVSTSMQTADFKPDRMTVAKQRAAEFVSERKGDRLGLVVFGSGSMTLCPLTLDRSILRSVIERLRIGTIDGNRTAIGMGLASAVARLKDSKSRSKVVILLTDGLNNAGEIEPQTAAELAATYGIRVYCIGVGSDKPVTVMVNDPLWGQRAQTVQADFDLGAIESISSITGGRAYAASDDAALRGIYDEINRLEPTRFKSTRHTLYAEKASLFMLPAALLFLIGLAVPAVALRRLP